MPGIFNHPDEGNLARREGGSLEFSPLNRLEYFRSFANLYYCCAEILHYAEKEELELKNRVIRTIQGNVREEIEIKGDYLTLGDCRETIFNIYGAKIDKSLDKGASPPGKEIDEGRARREGIRYRAIFEGFTRGRSAIGVRRIIKKLITQAEEGQVKKNRRDGSCNTNGQVTLSGAPLLANLIMARRYIVARRSYHSCSRCVRSHPAADT